MMARSDHGGRLRLILSSGLPMLAMLVATGCGNPEEGTVTVSPEARQRLRGGPPSAAKPAATRPGTKKAIDVRQPERRKPAD